MGGAITKNLWIQLRMSDPALAEVMVHPQNGDLFTLTKEMSVRFGLIGDKIEAFEKQLTILRLELEDWASQRSDLIDQVYLILKGDHFLFLVILKGKSHDGILEDALTDLDMRIAQDVEFDLINLSVLVVPAFAEDVIEWFLPFQVQPKDAGAHAERVKPSGVGQS